MKVKNIQDYYEIMYDQYPNIPKSDIRKILQYGYKSFYLHNSYGGDVLLNRKGFWLYSGNLTSNSLKYFEYYKRKMVVKLRVMYKRKKIQWDGYYYFALTKSQYEDYLKQKNKRGRPRKKFTFSKIILYKIYDECNISQSNRVAIFKIPLNLDLGFSIYKEKIECSNFELVLIRSPLKFQDILLSKYNYQFISDNSKNLKINKNE